MPYKNKQLTKARAKKKGVCTSCLARPARKGLSTCQQCVDGIVAGQRLRQKNGLCRSCPNKLNVSRKFCDKHLLLNRLEQRKRLGCQPWHVAKTGRKPFTKPRS